MAQPLNIAMRSKLIPSSASDSLAIDSDGGTGRIGPVPPQSQAPVFAPPPPPPAFGYVDSLTAITPQKPLSMQTVQTPSQPGETLDIGKWPRTLSNRSKLGDDSQAESRSQHLCSACQAIVSWTKRPAGQEKDYTSLPFQSSFTALRTSALTCPLCEFALQHVIDGNSRYQSWRGGKYGEALAYKVWVEQHRGLPSGLLKVTWVETPEDASPNPGSYYIANSTNIMRRAAWQPNDVTFDFRLQRVVEWISECNNHHIGCFEGTFTLPRRLLDLTSVQTSQQVKLIETSTIDQSTIHYATLSHCWGPPTKSPLKTIQSNHEEHSRGIVLDHLTPNFRDAVLICCKLGLDYIWIDSLCIIQDDGADWEVEAANMADIYRGSYLNIAATGARDAYGGIIGLSSLKDAQDRLTTIRDGGTDLTSKATSDETYVIQSEVGAEEYNLLSSQTFPYLTRGWVLQEQALSPRTVLFPQGQMFWQCRKSFISEDGTLYSDGFWSLANGYQSGSSFDFSSPDDARQTWHMWTKSYSARHLTYATDVSAAVAGLVNFFGEKMGYSPMLGLWKQTLAFDLGWTLDYRFGVEAPPLPPHESEFPSWSWLSVVHQPSFPADLILHSLYKENLVSLQVESYEEKWSGAAYTSKLESSKLTVSSFVRDATVYIPTDGRWRGILFQIIVSGTPSWKAHCNIQYLFPAGTKLAVKVLQISQGITPSSSVADTFLVLLKTKDDRPRAFYRIGLGEVTSRLPKGWDRGKHCEKHFKESDRESFKLE